MIAVMPSEKRIFMKEKYFLKEHQVIGAIVGLAWLALCLAIGFVCALAYALLIAVPAALAASQISNRFLSALVFSPVFVIMIVLTGPVFLFVREHLHSFIKTVTIKMYGPTEDEENLDW